MTAAALLALLKHTDEKTSYEQLRTRVVAQAVRNALQTFHGCPAFDPDDPASGEGFISDGQMRALNITIRRAVHEALAHVDTARNAATPAARPQAPCQATGSARISASSSSGRSVTTWSRRARPSWRKHTSVTSARFTWGRAGYPRGMNWTWNIRSNDGAMNGLEFARCTTAGGFSRALIHAAPSKAKIEIIDGDDRLVARADLERLGVVLADDPGGVLQSHRPS